MGALCSKSSTHSGGHTVLGPVDIPNTGSGQPRPDPRMAAAEAAERRRQAAMNRGTQASNPNQGKLAAQLEASKTAPRAPEPSQPERLVWD